MNSFADNKKLKELKRKANRLPLQPGVYIMKNKDGTIIYIGKAKALKNRVTQYFGSGNQHTEKVRRMVSNVNDFEYILCDSEFEALILENSLIKQNQPKYNILLKDDKGYFYIKITKEKWRKIETAKMLDDGGDFLGPYNSGYIVNQTVDEARKIFKIPDCNRNFDTLSRPCLNYHIGICSAPCKGKISLEEYNESVDSAIEFIKHGDSAGISLEKLNEKMLATAENMEFETAAKLRDRIRAIKKIRERQHVVSIGYKNQDVIATAFLGELACVQILVFRNYKLCDKKQYFLEGFSEKESLYNEFLQSFYLQNSDIPNRILLDADPDEFSAVSRWLSEKAGKNIAIINPKQGDGLKLLNMCLNNAAESLSQRSNRTGKEMSALNEIKDLLGLDSTPRRIEAYDISNTAGSNNVAAMIVFKDARPLKSAYRRFKIKGFSGQDDYRSMAEVLDRRFCEYEKAEDEAFSCLPDLILLDGAKGQITAVLPTLESHSINVPVFGMVKDSKHKTRAIATKGEDISIKSNRRAFTLITNIQDEVHRFAISYHRSLQSKPLKQTELLKIPGIGKAKASALLKHFGSLKKIKEATAEELQSVKGVTEALARAITEYFKNNA